MRLLLISLFVALSRPVVNAQLTPAEQQAIVDDHNFARLTLANPVATDMLEMQWDSRLAQLAQDYLATIPSSNLFMHSTAQWKMVRWNALGGDPSITSIGENWFSLYASSVTPPLATTKGIGWYATKAWTDGDCTGVRSVGGVPTCSTRKCSEKQSFYQEVLSNGQKCTNSFSTVGHFTQVMWAKSRLLGCAYKQGVGTLCEYAPGGNVGLTSGRPIVASDVWKIGTTAAGTAGKRASECPAFAPYNNDGLCSMTPPTNVVAVGAVEETVAVAPFIQHAKERPPQTQQQSSSASHDKSRAASGEEETAAATTLTALTEEKTVQLLGSHPLMTLQHDIKAKSTAVSANVLEPPAF